VSHFGLEFGTGPETETGGVLHDFVLKRLGFLGTNVGLESIDRPVKKFLHSPFFNILKNSLET